MALSFLLLQKSNRLQQNFFCGPDFCGKIERPEQQQEARAGPACSAHREVALGSVRIALEKMAGSSPLPQAAAETLPQRAQRSARWKEKGLPSGMSCAAFPAGCCLPCQPQQAQAAAVN